ncbi:MAG: glycine cleavage system protein GcvH [bacterium]|nr:glycine cleavage system protein GcvH [bacterium]
MNDNVLCTKTHEYIMDKGGDIYETGITDYAIEQLGDIVFIELPETDAEFTKNEVFATIESVKAASEIYMPISGKIVEINEELVNSPELLNDEGYENKWLVKFQSTADQVEFADLLDYMDYKEEVES